MEKPFAITLDPGSSLANRTGSWRTERPVYVDRLPPCNHACPAGEDIQGWLYHAESGDYRRAWEALVPHEGQITTWVDPDGDDLTLVKVHDLLARRGVVVPAPATLLLQPRTPRVFSNKRRPKSPTQNAKASLA